MLDEKSNHPNTSTTPKIIGDKGVSLNDVYSQLKNIRGDLHKVKQAHREIIPLTGSAIDNDENFEEQEEND